MKRAVSLVLALCAGCTLQSLTPRARFNDSAFALNDAARWGAVDVASQHVAASYRSRFLARRKAWGEGISIAEVELAQLRLGEDKQAESLVQLSWYDTNGMTLRRSSIAQKWQSQKGDYRLIDEEIAGGDRSVFADESSKTPR